MKQLFFCHHYWDSFVLIFAVTRTRTTHSLTRTHSPRRTPGVARRHGAKAAATCATCSASTSVANMAVFMTEIKRKCRHMHRHPETVCAAQSQSPPRPPSSKPSMASRPLSTDSRFHTNTHPHPILSLHSRLILTRTIIPPHHRISTSLRRQELKDQSVDNFSPQQPQVRHAPSGYIYGHPVGTYMNI